MTNLDCVEKQRHYSANQVCIVKAMVFPVVMYGCESWTMKKADYYMTTGKTKRTFVGKVMCVCF